jgi:hypothetical protein
MIASISYLLLYLALGVLCVRFLLPKHKPLNRIWLGLSFGVLLEMWLPALFAFAFGFTAAAHAAAAGMLLIVTAACWFLRDKRDAAPWDEEEKKTLYRMLPVLIPLVLLSGYLQYTHVMRVDAAGNWHVGQSTYGDLPMHLSFITGLTGKTFPADYPFYPGARLSYPFLTDTFSSTFYLLGSSLQASVIIPGTLMMALCFMGVLVLGREMTAGGKIMILVALLFFLNGGLGFLYDFDLSGGSWSGGYFETVGERIQNILTGYYKTPTNQPDPNNLRWSNVICDLMVPQRTLLGGWCAVFPCFYLLDAVFRAKKRDPGNGVRGLILLGIWAGALPMIHTHSFLALALASFGAMIYDWIHGDPDAMMIRRTRWQILWPYLVYAGITAALAAPQLILFTFRQAFQEGAGHSFLQFQFNWVNNPSGRGMRDLYIWFYVKNIGLPFLALIAALFDKTPRHRRLFAMALPIILAAEFIRFQPNEYDNNKLLYIAWLLCFLIVADWCAIIWKKLKGLRSRYVLAVIAAVVTFLSAGLTIWRECVSDYVAYSSASVEAGEFARDQTEKDAVFLSGTQHLNPVLSIGGKTVVCGPDLWLYWHGFDTWERQQDIRMFFEDPESFPEIPQKYNTGYIYVSSYERGEYDVDEDALDRMYRKVFENGEATIWKIPEG